MQKRILLKSISALLALASVFLLTSINVYASDKPACLIILSTAKRFEDKSLGEGGIASKLYKAYQEAFEKSDSIKKEDLDWLLINGTPAGKVYAAMLLRGTKKVNDKNSFGRLSKDESKIEFQSGCEIMEDKVNSIAQSFIKKGDYMGIKYLQKDTK